MSKWLGITAGIYDFFFILFDNIEGYIPVWVIVNQINIKIIYLYMRSFINRNAIYNITIIFKTIEIRSVYIFNYFRKSIKANWIIFSCDKVTSYFFDNSNTLNMVWVMVKVKYVLLPIFLSVTSYCNIFRCVYQHFYIINI